MAVQKKTRASQLRTATITVVAVLVVAGAIGNIAVGSLSGFGVKGISAICPLGYLEASLASRTLLPRLLVPFLAIALSVLILGRVFCSWVCPIPLLKSFLPAKRSHGAAAPEAEAPAAIEAVPQIPVRISNAGVDLPPEKPEAKQASTGLLVLGGTLLSSAIFGFPVFCLVCPIGLTFATLFAVIRLFHFNEPTLDLILYPAIIVAELLLLRKWCSRICPVGALLALISRGNRSLVPSVDGARCLALSRGTKCDQCHEACAYEIDLKSPDAKSNLNQCTKCRECAEHCPVHAISFPLWRRS